MNIRWGVIGTGWISDKFATDMKTVENSGITAVLSRSEGKAKAFASRFDIEHPCIDKDDFFSLNDVDIIYVGTPHNEHYQNTMDALSAGKHVLCEKPMAVNSIQAEQMIKTAREKGLFLMEAWWTAFIPAVIKTKELISEGRLGAVCGIQANLGFVLNLDPAARLMNPALAGGALLDVGIYPLQFANYFTGQTPERIDARSVMSATGVDEITCVTAEYPDRTILQAGCAASRMLVNDARLYGDRGYVYVPPNFHNADRCLLVLNDGSREEFPYPRTTEGYDYEIRAVNNMIRDGQKTPDGVTHELTLTTIRMMDSIRKQIGLKYPFE